MDTTITDMARFAAGLARGDGLSTKARREMVHGQLPISTASQFPTLQPDLPPASQLKDVAAGLGVIAFTGPQGPGFFMSGHNDSSGSNLLRIERGKCCVVIRRTMRAPRRRSPNWCGARRDGLAVGLGISRSRRKEPSAAGAKAVMKGWVDADSGNLRRRGLSGEMPCQRDQTAPECLQCRI